MGQPSAWLIPLPVTHLYKDSSRLADKALLGGPASVGSQKPSYCGLQRISRSFEKQTSLHPDCGSRVLSLSFGEGLFRRLEKPELIFNFWLPKPPHVWSVDDLRLQNDGREGGNVVWGSVAFPPGAREGALAEQFDPACAHSSLIWVSQKCPPPRPPAVTFPLDVSWVFPGVRPFGAR